MNKLADEIEAELEFECVAADEEGWEKEYAKRTVLLRKALVALRQIDEALSLAEMGQIDGGHHKTWVIDQMVRCLTGDEYDQWVANAKAGEDGPETYDWDVGLAP